MYLETILELSQYGITLKEIRKIKDYQKNLEVKSLQELHEIIFDVYTKLMIQHEKYHRIFKSSTFPYTELYKYTQKHLYYHMKKQDKKDYEKRFDDIENMIKYHPGGMEYDNAKEDFEKLNKTTNNNSNEE